MKKTLAILLVIMLLMTTLVGCDDGADSSAPETPTTSTSKSESRVVSSSTDTTAVTTTTSLPTSTTTYTRNVSTTRSKTVKPSVPHTCVFTMKRTVAATCVAQGYTEFACTCGKIEKRNLTPVAAEQHNFQKGIPFAWKDHGSNTINDRISVCKNCQLRVFRHGRENEQSQTKYYLAVLSENQKALNLRLLIYGSGPMSDYESGSGYAPGWGAFSAWISSVTIAEGVTTIGANAFYDELLSLREFHISSTVKKLGEGAMYGARRVEIRLGKNVEEIGYRGIYEGVNKVYVPATMKQMEAYPSGATIYYQGTEEMYRRIMVRRSNDVVYLRTMEQFFKDCKEGPSPYYYDDGNIDNRVHYNAW